MYQTIAHDIEFRRLHSESTGLRFYETLLKSWPKAIKVQWRDHGDYLLECLLRYNTFSNIVRFLEAAEAADEELKPVIPFAMYHLWSLVEGMVVWMGELQPVPASRLSAFIRLKAQLGSGALVEGATAVSMRDSGIIQMAEGWVAQLETLVTIIPNHIFHSGILAALLASGDMVLLHNARLHSILERCDLPMPAYSDDEPTDDYQAIPALRGSRAHLQGGNRPRVNRLYARALKATKSEIAPSTITTNTDRD